MAKQVNKVYDNGRKNYRSGSKKPTQHKLTEAEIAKMKALQEEFIKQNGVKNFGTSMDRDLFGKVEVKVPCKKLRGSWN